MDTLLKKIGRQGANRLVKEFLDESNDKATTTVFEKVQYLMENYVTCKETGRFLWLKNNQPLRAMHLRHRLVLSYKSYNGRLIRFSYTPISL